MSVETQESQYFGGFGGNPFEDFLENNTIIGFLLHKNNNYLSYIQPIFSDESTGLYHGTYFAKPEKFQLEKEEKWNCINIKCSGYLDAVQFVTNKRTSKWYGGNGGTLYKYDINGTIIGLKGRSGAWIDGLQFVTGPSLEDTVNNENLKQFSKDFDNYILKNKFGDCRFILNKSKEVQVNNPSFEKLFSDKKEVYVDTKDVDSFIEMLKYVYTGSCSISNENYMNLVEIAEKYQLTDLKNNVFEYIIKGKCNAENVCQLLMETKQGNFSTFGSEELQKRCIKFISENTKRVCKSQDFVNLDKEFVFSLLKQEELDLQEVDLFSAVYRWGLNKINKENLQEPIKDVIAEFLPLIRFTTMEGKDLVKVVKPTGLIDKDYYLKILEMLTAPEGYEHKNPLPEVQSRGVQNFILDPKTAGFSSLFTMSNKNLTIKKISGGNTWSNAMVFGSVKLNKGEHYWEFKVDSINNDRSGTAVGLCINNKAKNQYSTDMVVGLSGYQYNLSGNSTTSFNNGDRIGVFFSWRKKKVFFYYNGTKMQVEGNLQSGQLYWPVIHIYYVNDQFTLNFPKTKPKI